MPEDFFKDENNFLGLRSVQHYAKNYVLVPFHDLQTSSCALWCKNPPSEPAGFYSLLHCQTSWRSSHPLPYIIISPCVAPCSLGLYSTLMKLFFWKSRMVFQLLSWMFFLSLHPLPFHLQNWTTFLRQHLLPRRCYPLP